MTDHLIKIEVLAIADLDIKEVAKILARATSTNQAIFFNYFFEEISSLPMYNQDAQLIAISDHLSSSALNGVKTLAEEGARE